MRLKHDSENSKEFKCCFCCHVRVGTIVYGLFLSIVFLAFIGCWISTCLHPELLQDSLQTEDYVVSSDVSKDGTEITISNDSWENSVKMRMEVLPFIAICMFVFALMLVYGAVRNRPCFLLPYFCVQVIDFCLACLAIVGYMTHAPNIKLWLSEQGFQFVNQNLYDHVQKMDEQWLFLLCVIVFVLLLTIKAYLINMVWTCYRYLQLVNANRSVVREYTVDPDSEMLLPPKYEEAMKMPAAGTMPPPYSE